MSNIYDIKEIITEIIIEPLTCLPACLPQAAKMFACKQTLANLKLRGETLQRPQVIHENRDFNTPQSKMLNFPRKVGDSKILRTNNPPFFPPDRRN